ncbi:PCRF domain-containing protein [Nostoc linckia]|uniref:PCRF domain-containing protein n=1 Tax=Nostoc linckia TaxID=92942 RepID=UPI000BFFC3D5|nr:PCRF domain-containing protein [Nostoc linckia]
MSWANQRTVFDLRYLTVRIHNLNQLIAKTDFWENVATAHQTSEKIKYFISKRQEKYQRSLSILQDIEAALELLESSVDEQLLQEVQINLTQLQQEIETAQIRQLLSNPYNSRGALLTITTEIGDIQAQNWASILFRMYYLWGLSHLHQVCGLDINDKEKGNISYALEITGRYAYG